MAEINLEFEKPILELEKKLKEWIELSKTNKMELGDEVSALKKKLTETMKNIYDSLTPWQRVQLARHPERPYTLDYINNIFTDFMELHGDRRMRDDAAIVGGFAKFDGTPVMVIGTQKGRNTKENVFRNFGWPHPEGYRKALRLMQVADLAKAPIITFIDTPGAFPGIASEERHIGEAIAINMREMFGLKVPVISVIIGEGGSGGAIGIGVGNRIRLRSAIRSGIRRSRHLRLAALHAAELFPQGQLPRPGRRPGAGAVAARRAALPGAPRRRHRPRLRAAGDAADEQRRHARPRWPGAAALRRAHQGRVP